MRCPAAGRLELALSRSMLLFTALTAFFCAGCLRTVERDPNVALASRAAAGGPEASSLDDPLEVSILKAGALQISPVLSLLSAETAGLLRHYGWTGSEWAEHLYPYRRSAATRFCLMYRDGSRQSMIAHVIDLRWKVNITTTADVEEFLDLIGGKRTKLFFRDSRGWEIVSRDTPEADNHCSVSQKYFEQLGLKPRKIKRISGGFIVRRTLYREPHVRFPCDLPGDLIEAREFIGNDGQYVFGCERIIAERAQLPPISVTDQHKLLMTDYYRAMFPRDCAVR